MDAMKESNKPLGAEGRPSLTYLRTSFLKSSITGILYVQCNIKLRNKLGRHDTLASENSVFTPSVDWPE